MAGPDRVIGPGRRLELVEVGRLLAIGLPWQAIMEMEPEETEAILEGYQDERVRQIPQRPEGDG